MARNWRAVVLGVCVLLVGQLARGEVLTIDVSHPDLERKGVDLGQGTFADPAGHTIGADSRSFLLDGKPWVPVAGEFHYSRYPRGEWREELLKMKAGGISVVSTYVFWIHQEEERGVFDWSDRRSLREFLMLCKEVGLKAIVRMGPWDHGEVRNGGFPEWVQKMGGAGVKLRTTDPAFLALVKPFYEEMAGQMKGLLWKDGGPVIGIQVDNECSNLAYLLALKGMAKEAGVDVPLYTMTGWNGARIPTKDLLPLFGAYADGFWGGTMEKYRKSFEFTEVRDDGDLGAQIVNTHPDRSNNIELWPYACCEIGGGMMSSDAHRIKVDPEYIAAMALVKLGSGNNMPGYYMYQGGVNPSGKEGHLEEDHPNVMPVKDYDFQAPLGACGEERRQYGLLREQHLFLEDFGGALAGMPAMFPEKRPVDLKDFATVRWSVRSDGEKGFLFFNNEQPLVALPGHKDVQFSVKMKGETVVVPRGPVTIPSGSYGIWPVNMDCDGVVVKYATVQPLCRVKVGDTAFYFFAAAQGISPEFCIGKGDWTLVANEKYHVQFTDTGAYVTGIVPKLDSAFMVAKADRSADPSFVDFVVLTPEQALHLSRQEFGGKERLVESAGTVFADGGELHVQAEEASALGVAVFPPMSATFGVKLEGAFQSFAAVSAPTASAIEVGVKEVSSGEALAETVRADDEGTWGKAAVWGLRVPEAARGRRVILRVKYVGDAVRVYDGEKLVDDQIFNGDALDVALWRIPVEEWGKLTVRVLPLTEKVVGRLPAEVRGRVVGTDGKVMGASVEVKAVEVLERRVGVGK
jgi:beta-galactosidase